MSRLGGMMMGKRLGKRHKEGRTKYIGKGGGAYENKIKELIYYSKFLFLHTLIILKPDVVDLIF